MESGAEQWRRFKVKTVEPGSLESADDAYFSIDIVNYTNGVVDNTWTDTDYNDVYGQLITAINAWLPYMDTTKSIVEIAAYVMAFNPDYIAPPQLPAGEKQQSPFLPSGPPESVHVTSLPGAGAGAVQASQVSASVTKLVPLRRHWGRFYLPFPDANTLSGARQFTTAVVDAQAAAWHLCFLNLSQAQFYPVIAQTQSGRATAQALLQLTGIQVDSNPDVIRRRRAHTTLYKKTLSG